MNPNPTQLTILTAISLTCFLTASGLSVLGFKPAGGNRVWLKVGYFLFLIGTFALTILSLMSTSAGVWFACVVAWLSIISWFIWHIELIAAFTSPIIAILQLVIVFFSAPPSTLAVASGTTAGLRIHIASALAGQALAVLACGMSLLLLWLDKKLKSRQLTDLPDSFPGMSTLSRALHITLASGFSFLTISLLSGAVFVMSGNLNPEANFAGKIIWALFVWVWYLTILVLRGILGYKPQKVARLSLIGFALMTAGWIFIWYATPWSLR